jgi:ankyrin repeat protein
VNGIDKDGQTPITRAIKSHWAHFIEMHKCYSDAERKELEYRAYQLLEPIMDYLIAHGANLDLFGHDGMTPLCAAYYANSVAATRYLLEHGADPNINCHIEDHCYVRPIKSRALQLIYD